MDLVLAPNSTTGAGVLVESGPVHCKQAAGEETWWWARVSERGWAYFFQLFAELGEGEGEGEGKEDTDFERCWKILKNVEICWKMLKDAENKFCSWSARSSGCFPPNVCAQTITCRYFCFKQTQLPHWCSKLFEQFQKHRSNYRIHGFLNFLLYFPAIFSPFWTNSIAIMGEPSPSTPKLRGLARPSTASRWPRDISRTLSRKCERSCLAKKDRDQQTCMRE